LRRYRHIRSGRESSSLLDLADGAEVDRAGLSDLLAFGYQSGCRTLLSGVERVLPHWDPAPPALHPDALSTLDERADRLWQLLRDAVARASSHAKRPRTTLSGGLDSRAVAAAAASLDSSRFTVGTFGDEDCVDLPVAEGVAQRLGLRQQVSVLTPGAALAHEERVWRATSGYGGPAAAPGAATDRSWAEQCDVLLSGTSGDVIWGDSAMPGPSPARRLGKLGCPYAEPRWSEDLPPAPLWVSAAGAASWRNLWTRQQGATWDGVLPRLAFTQVVPVLWDEPLLSYCLALGAEDRCDRMLLRHMLERHAPEVSASALPSVRGPVHDLDRAWRTSPAWAEELEYWLAQDAATTASWQALGLRRQAVDRMVSQVRGGRRSRAGFLSRLRAAWRWGVLLSSSR
jgi:asparagine synthetase B (glutamine-hydrolysing)